jgi:TP901 family phage tail tape measure protein
VSTAIVYNIIARDGASAVFGRVAAAAESTASRVSKAGTTMVAAGKKMSHAITLPVTVAAGASVKMAVDFQASMTRVSTQAGASAADVKTLTDQVLQLGKYAEQSPKELADSLYHLKSVGMDNVSAMKALKQASDLAAVGGASLEETTNALAGAWRSGIKGATDFHGAVATVNAIIGAGNMKMEDFNLAIGTGILPAAKTFGLSLQSVGAALALMTDEGIPANVAATRLRMSFSLLAAPSHKAEGELNSIGLSGLKLAEAMRGPGGLIGAIGLLKEHLDKSGLSASKQAQFLSHAFGGGRSSSAIMTLLNNYDVLRQKQDQVNASMGRFDKAVSTQRKTAEGQFKLFKSTIEVLAVKLGTALLPPLIQIARQLGRLADGFAKLPSPIKRGAVEAALFAAALGPAMTIMGRIVQVAGFAAKGIGGVASAASMTARTVGGFVTGLRNIDAAMAADASVATRLGAAIRSQILLWRQQAAAAGVSTGRIIIQAAAQKAVAAATRVWAAAQAVFNAVMDANPIALVILAIVALGAALVLAYKKSSTFRNIVNATFNGLKTVVQAVIGFVVPFVQKHWKLMLAIILGPLGPAFLIISTFWKQIWHAIQVAWALIHPVLNAIAGFLKGTFRVAWIVIQNTIKIVWIAIQIYIKIAWTLIKGYFNLMKFYITKILAPVFWWLYNNVVKPVWNFIAHQISVIWGAIKRTWNTLASYLKGPLTSAFRWAQGQIRTIWNGVGTAIAWVWDHALHPAFNKIKDMLSTMRGAFRTAVSGIKSEWDKLKGVAKAPVNFMIGVYNKGVVDLVNGIAKFAGVKTRLNHVPTFATGGILPGYAPGRDTMIAAVSPGESIFRPEFTRAVGADFVHAANRHARTGGPAAVRNWLTGPHALGGEGLAFARGGVVPGFAGKFGFGGIVGGFVDGLKKFAFGAPEKALKSALNKILGGSVPGAGLFHDAIAAIPKWIADRIMGWFKSKISSGGGLIGGKGFANALAWAKSQAGKPYVWGGVGPGGYDCSGFMSAITNVIHGHSPYSRLFSTRSFGASGGPGGFVRNLRSAFMVGVTNAGVGHMAGTLNGVNVESSGSRGVHYGPGARGYNNSLFGYRYGLKADSGALLLQPGLNPPVLNATGRPEYLETPRRGGGGPLVNVEHLEVREKADIDLIARRLENLITGAAL